MSMKNVAIASLGLWITGGCLGATDDELETSPPAEQAGVPERTGGWADIDTVPYAIPESVGTRRAERAMGELSREELADALRPVLMTRDGTRIAREPNWAAADAIRRTGEPSMAYDAGANGDFETTPYIIGADGRTRVPDTTIAPFSSMAKIHIFKDGGWWGCTGTYIGPWTFVTAGHCLRATDGSVARRITFDPARNGATLPFGSFACANDDTGTSNDFLAAIPSGYVASGDSNFDFAVVDTFPCHRAPRWLGMPATNQGILVDTGTTTYAVHGYPGPACPGAPGGSNYNCGMSGPAYVNGNWIETEHIDADHGQSGGPWHVGGRVAGTLIGYREYFDLFRCGFDVCRRTFGRRIDGAYKSFLDTVAFDYP